MPIVSISLSNSDLQDLNKLQEEGGFGNRSELIRQALRALIHEVHDLDQLKGTLSAVLTIVYAKKGKGLESNFLLHRQATLIDALLHSHTVNGECIEVMVLNGPAQAIRELVKMVKGNRKVRTANLAIIGET